MASQPFLASLELLVVYFFWVRIEVDPAYSSSQSVIAEGKHASDFSFFNLQSTGIDRHSRIVSSRRIESLFEQLVLSPKLGSGYGPVEISGYQVFDVQ